MTQFALDLVAEAAGATPARAHSVLGASSYYRWKRSACPGSVRLTKGMPRQSSIYAAEGSVAHAIGEFILLTRLGRETEAGFAESHAAGKTVEFDGHPIEITAEMWDHATFYADTVWAEYKPEDGDILLVEQRVDLSSIHPGLFGTSDVILLKPRLRKIIVFDLKYGAGIAVDAEENEQLQYYCVGGMIQTKAAVEEAEVVIVQPRAFHTEGPVRRWPFKAIEIFDFIGELKEDAIATEDALAVLRAGDHCRFCPAAQDMKCPELQRFSIEQAKNEFAPLSTAAAEFAPANAVGYDPVKLGEALAAVSAMETWIANVKSFARAEALAGRIPPGYKLVRGNGSREFKDSAKTTAWLLLGHGVAESAMYTTPELKSVAQIEEMIAALPLEKKAKAAVKKEFKNEHVRTVPGGLLLVSQDHARKAVEPIADAQQDFGAIAVVE